MAKTSFLEDNDELSEQFATDFIIITKYILGQIQTNH